MRIAVISANLGGYDVQVPWVDQVVPGASVDVFRLTDQTFPPRQKAMTPALQCGIAKMFGWQLYPDYDTYIWVDASRGLLRPDTALWFTLKAGPADLLLFRHPERATVQEEYDFVKAKLRVRSRYLTSRYDGEWLDAQFGAVEDQGGANLPLFASTAFLYRPTPEVKALLKEWWYHKSRFLLHDQLALPLVVADSRARVQVVDDDVYHCDHLPITRAKR